MKLIFKKSIYFWCIIFGVQPLVGWSWFGKKKKNEQIVEQSQETDFSDESQKIEQKEKKYDVRVLLTECKLTEPFSFVIESKKGFYLLTLDGTICLKYESKNITISADSKSILLDDKKVAHQQFFIKPIEGLLSHQGQSYEGYLLINKTNTAIELINILDLEEYVCSVLNCESWPGWPKEVNKAFAIASRSYVVHKMQHTQLNKNKLYHIKNTNIHQTYKGTHQSESLKEAVQETKGIVVAYNNKAIEAMFDCCCGGIIPANIAGINFETSPYLARKQVCNFCKSCKIHGWKLEYPIAEFELLLQRKGYQVKKIRSIDVIKRDKAGTVQLVSIRAAQGSLLLSGRQLYSLCSKIKSFSFKIEKNRTHIVFTGKGYGHHLGICQWGARRMLDAGYNYESILHFYYPSTTLMNLA